MAPSNTTMDCGNDNGKAKSSLRQMRKPVVEKMRRDRINSSIKQLRMLLEKEFQRHQPNSKLEKADILEMTVNYLRQQHLQMNANALGRTSPFQDYNQGFNRCLEETLQFLSYTEKHMATNRKVMQHFKPSLPMEKGSPEGTASTKQTTPNTAAIIWRPW
ncbi:transcription factor HES-5-like [Discoglossus pictus]